MLKQERNEQWGSSENRGWDRWRITTFLEVIEAKAGRAVIAQHKYTEDNDLKYRNDLIDSLQDLINYTNKVLEKIDRDEEDTFISGDDTIDQIKIDKK